MRVRLLKDCEGPTGTMKAGSIVDDPRAARLIDLGVAAPFDPESFRHAAKKKKQFAAKFDDHPSKPVQSAAPVVVVPPVAEKPKPQTTEEAWMIPDDLDDDDLK